MIIDKSIMKFSVYEEETVFFALQKIDKNNCGIIFVVKENGRLLGVLTDGDIRRWLISDQVDLHKRAGDLVGHGYVSAPISASASEILALFSDKIRFVPLVNPEGYLVAVARHRGHQDGLHIGNFHINEHSPVFIIAEIGNNHNGCVRRAKALVDYAIDVGANCAKFQMRDLESLYANAGNASDASLDLGSQYTLDLLTRFQLKTEEMFEVFDYCKQQGILPLCTPWDVKSVERLEHYGMPAYKVASADLTNHTLLEILARTGKPLICSTGMSREQEIIESVGLLQKQGALYALLHCNSTYPTPFKDVNLHYMARLKELGCCQVGYSGHERGISVPLAAVALGAVIIEKHLTLNKRLEGNDHRVSLLPAEFKQMVEGIRDIELALGHKMKRTLSQGEMMNRETLAKSLVINCALKKGAVIRNHMLSIKSPGQGLQPNHKTKLVGRLASRDFLPGDFFFKSDITGAGVKVRYYQFDRPWGIPVRFHDYRALIKDTNPDVLEFHLSYKDLEENLSDFFDTILPYRLLVHSPELFGGDHILDLCSTNENYRQRSIAELQRVIDVTRLLSRFFVKQGPIGIITNVGGFSQMAPLDNSQRMLLYQTLIESLNVLDSEGVEILPQTMPPFPWHLGGQQFHNIFVDPFEIVNFCRQHYYRVCLDVSHAKLACNEYRQSFKAFIEKVAPFAAHLHLGDARGQDGEGLQIGEGDIDFDSLLLLLTQHCREASFIPEIWQGHKNGGEGFWVALDALESMMSKIKVTQIA